MRRFRFRLAPVLRLRAQLERVARRDLAAALSSLATLDQQFEAASQGLRDCAEQAAHAGPVGALSKAFEDGLRRHQWRLQERRQQAQRAAEAARAQFAQRAADRKALARLRDQQLAAWRAEAQRVEQADADEITVMARGAGERTGRAQGALH